MSQIPLGMLKEIEFSFSEQIYESVLSVCLSVSPSLSLSLSLSLHRTIVFKEVKDPIFA